MIPGEELLFVALGGSGEIGMNVNLYGCRGQWIMVDLGLNFAGPDYPGIELILPDLEFIEDQQERISGIILTSVSLWATYVMYLIYLKAKKRAHKAARESTSPGDVQLKVVDPANGDFEQGNKMSPIREEKLEPTAVRKLSLFGLYSAISIVSFSFFLVLMSAN